MARHTLTITEDEVLQYRRETPGTDTVAHFNNAGSSLPPQPVLDTVVDYLREEALKGGYEAAAEHSDRLERVYGLVAELVNGAPEEIALTENATRAWDVAFYSIPFQPGDRVLTADNEYASNYIAFLQMRRRLWIEIVVIPSDSDGVIDLDALRREAEKGARLIALTHAPTNGGLVQPAEAVGQVARDTGTLYLLDACQSAGQWPLDVENLGCHFLSATGRKYLRAPRGTGFLYVRKDVLQTLEPPFLDLLAAEWVSDDEYVIRPDAKRFESFSASQALRLGLGRAVEYALEIGIERIQRRVQALAESLREALEDIPGVRVRDQGREKSGIVTFTLEGWEPMAVQERLAEQRINVGSTYPRHSRLNTVPRGISGMTRASVHYYNSQEEVEQLYRVVRELAGGR